MRAADERNAAPKQPGHCGPPDGCASEQVQTCTTSLYVLVELRALAVCRMKRAVLHDFFAFASEVSEAGENLEARCMSLCVAIMSTSLTHVYRRTDGSFTGHAPFILPAQHAFEQYGRFVTRQHPLCSLDH